MRRPTFPCIGARECADAVLCWVRVRVHRLVSYVHRRASLWTVFKAARTKDAHTAPKSQNGAFNTGLGIAERAAMAYTHRLNYTFEARGMTLVL